MIFNFAMGVSGLILAGDSLGRGIRLSDSGIFVIGSIELLAGLFFLIAAIGAGSGG